MPVQPVRSDDNVIQAQAHTGPGQRAKRVGTASPGVDAEAGRSGYPFGPSPRSLQTPRPDDVFVEVLPDVAHVTGMLAHRLPSGIDSVDEIGIPCQVSDQRTSTMQPPEGDDQKSRLGLILEADVAERPTGEIRMPQPVGLQIDRADSIAGGAQCHLKLVRLVEGDTPRIVCVVTVVHTT